MAATCGSSNIAERNAKNFSSSSVALLTLVVVVHFSRAMAPSVKRAIAPYNARAADGSGPRRRGSARTTSAPGVSDDRPYRQEIEISIPLVAAPHHPLAPQHSPYNTPVPTPTSSCSSLHDARRPLLPKDTNVPAATPTAATGRVHVKHISTNTAKPTMATDPPDSRDESDHYAGLHSLIPSLGVGVGATFLTSDEPSEGHDAIAAAGQAVPTAAAPPSYQRDSLDARENTPRVHHSSTDVEANADVTPHARPQMPHRSPPPPPPRRSRSSKRGQSAAALSPEHLAKKHVQSFFKAFGDTFEPRLKDVVDSSMHRQSIALRSAIAKHEDEVRELVRSHDDRMTDIISKHQGEMAKAVARTKSQLEEHLSIKTHEQNVAIFEKELADYYRKRGLSRMLFWASILGIVIIAVVFQFELWNGHLGGIMGFSISAGYMYLSYRRSLPLKPRRPCPYGCIEGPYVPEGENRRSTTPQPPWYMNLQRFNLWHREPAAYGLFD